MEILFGLYKQPISYRNAKFHFLDSRHYKTEFVRFAEKYAAIRIFLTRGKANGIL